MNENKQMPHNCQDKTIQQLFEKQVERTPDNIAVGFKNQSLTYRELNNYANQLAHYIHQQYHQVNNDELQPDTIIALYLDRSLEMIIGILGVLKAGAAYVPIDPEWPQERIHHILNDTDTDLLLTQTHHESSVNTVIHP